MIITQAPAATCKARWQSSGASLEAFEKSMQARCVLFFRSYRFQGFGGGSRHDYASMSTKQEFEPTTVRRYASGNSS